MVMFKKTHWVKQSLMFLIFCWCSTYAKCEPINSEETNVAPEPNYEQNVQSLIERDPFKLQLKPGISFDDFVRENEDYAFNGVIEKNRNNRVYDFSITNRLTGKSFWLSSEGATQQNDQSVQFFSFDEKNKTLILQTHEGLKKIPLTRSLYTSQGETKESIESFPTNYSGNIPEDIDNVESDDEEDDELFKAADKDALENYRKKLEALKDVSSEE